MWVIRVFFSSRVNRADAPLLGTGCEEYTRTRARDWWWIVGGGVTGGLLQDIPNVRVEEGGCAYFVYSDINGVVLNAGITSETWTSVFPLLPSFVTDYSSSSSSVSKLQSFFNASILVTYLSNQPDQSASERLFHSNRDRHVMVKLSFCASFKSPSTPVIGWGLLSCLVELARALRCHHRLECRILRS